MSPKTKAVTAKPLLGQPDSALGPDFLAAVLENKPYEHILPFARPLEPKLPTTEQVLKLYYFLRELVGKKNVTVSNFDLSKEVAGYVSMYWNMAGFQTLVFSRIVNHVQKAVETYQKLIKHISRTSFVEVARREKFEQDKLKLFDIATPGLEDLLKKDRILGNDDDCTLYREEEGYTRKSEDIAFLIDQRGERKMVMGVRDPSYELRVDNSNLKKKRKLDLQLEVRNGNSVTKQPLTSNDHDENVEDNDLEDMDFSVKQTNRKKDDMVLIELPRDLMNSPEVCAMLDRTGTSSRKAIGVVSSIIKAGKIDGKEADLANFSLSRTDLERKKILNRTELMKQSIENFKRNKPKYPVLH